MDKCKRCKDTGIVLRYPNGLIPRGSGKSLFIPCPDCIGETIPIFKEININKVEVEVK